MAIEDGFTDSITLRASGSAVGIGRDFADPGVTIPARVVATGGPHSHGEVAEQPISTLSRKVMCASNPDLEDPDTGEARKLRVDDGVDVASEAVRYLAAGPMRAIKDNSGVVVYYVFLLGGLAP